MFGNNKKLICLGIYSAAVTAVAAFLGKEMYKKFHFEQTFAGNADDHVVDFIPGEHPEPSNFKKGTWKIVLKSEEPFCAKCGGHLTILGKDWGLDYYAVAESSLDVESGSHKAVFEVFIKAWNEDPGTAFDIRPFVFFINRRIKGTSMPVTVSATDEDQSLAVTTSSKPHKWQEW